MSTALSAIVDPAALTPERVLHWLVAPLSPEQVDDLMLPVLLGGTPLVVSCRGLVLPSTLDDGTDLLVDGRIGVMNSRFSVQRRGADWHVLGHRADHNVDFVLKAGAEAWSVTGKTGHFHADCSITTGANLEVSGLLGGDHCNYEVTIGPDALQVKGVEHGENVHFDVQVGATGWTWKGEGVKGYLDLTLQDDDGRLAVSGTLFSQPCKFHVDRRPDGLYLEGYSAWGTMHFSIVPQGRGYIVHGRGGDDGHLDYTVSLLTV